MGRKSFFGKEECVTPQNTTHTSRGLWTNATLGQSRHSRAGVEKLSPFDSSLMTRNNNPEEGYDGSESRGEGQ